MKWTLWFIASVIWFFAFGLIVMVVTPEELQQLGHNWLFMLGFVLSIVNLLFCVYVGATEREEECI